MIRTTVAVVVLRSARGRRVTRSLSTVNGGAPTPIPKLEIGAPHRTRDGWQPTFIMQVDRPGTVDFHALTTRTGAPTTSPPQQALGAPLKSIAASAPDDAVNREAQIATMLMVGFAVALFGWALVHIASSPTPPHEVRRRTGSRFRRWLDATRHRLLRE
jgi:hypothetical protein